MDKKESAQVKAGRRQRRANKAANKKFQSKIKKQMKKNQSQNSSSPGSDNSGIGARLTALEAKVDQIADGITTVWNNQVELSNSAEKVDEQFCALVRLSVVKINEVIARLAVPSGVRIPSEPITYDSINELFEEFSKFKARPDFRDHFQTWYMGGDIDALPDLVAELSELKSEGDTVTDAPEGDEHAAQRDQTAGTADEAPGEQAEDPLHELPTADHAADQPANPAG